MGAQRLCVVSTGQMSRCQIKHMKILGTNEQEICTARRISLLVDDLCTSYLWRCHGKRNLIMSTDWSFYNIISNDTLHCESGINRLWISWPLPYHPPSCSRKIWLERRFTSIWGEGASKVLTRTHMEANSDSQRLWTQCPSLQLTWVHGARKTCI